MNPTMAALSLNDHLVGQQWFLTVGVAGDKLIVYRKLWRYDRSVLPKNWEGYAVSTKYMGIPGAI
jgi:hypothetical protein